MAQDLPTKELVQFLGKLPVFERLTVEQRTSLLDQCRLHSLEQREVMQLRVIRIITFGLSSPAKLPWWPILKTVMN